MSFDSFTIDSRLYRKSGEGIYILDSIEFGQPKDWIQIREGQLSKDKRSVIAVITRLTEKENTPTDIFNGAPPRSTLKSQYLIDIPVKNFTSSETDVHLSDISALADVETITRILHGEK